MEEGAAITCGVEITWVIGKQKETQLKNHKKVQIDVVARGQPPQSTTQLFREKSSEMNNWKSAMKASHV